MKLLSSVCLFAALLVPASAQTVTLLDLSPVVSSGPTGLPPLPAPIPTGASLSFVRAYSESVPLFSPGPAFFGGFTFTYTNNTNGPLQVNPIPVIGHAMILLATTAFNGTSGSFSTEVEGLVFVPVSGLTSDIVPFAEFAPEALRGNRQGTLSDVSGQLRNAIRIGTDWFVSDDAMLPFTFITTTTTVSSILSNQWRPFDPVALSYGAAQLLPGGEITGIGAYFDQVGTVVNSTGGNYVSDLRFVKLGYTATAVPEPSTYGLAGGVILVASFLRRRKKRAA